MSLESYLAEIGFPIPPKMESKPDRSIKFRRIDTEDDSTLVCKCGSGFTWEGIDSRLDDWIDQHLAHVE